MIARFLRSLGGSGPVPNDLDEAAAALRSRLAGQRILLLLDNAASAEQVRPLLPGDGAIAVVITARRTLSTLDAVHVRVGKLPPDAAATLLTRLLGSGRAAAEPAALRRIAEACGHLPLALRIAGARLSSRPEWPLHDLADRLESEHRRLDELHTDDLDVRAGFEISHRALAAEPDPAAAAAVVLFRLLGLVDVEVAVGAVAVLLDRDEHDAEQAAERLCRDHLLEPAGARRYRCHDLLRIFAREQSETLPAGERDAAVQRLLCWYAGEAVAANRLLHPGLATGPAGGSSLTGRDEALRWLDAERQNFDAVLRQCDAAPAETRRLALALALELGPYLNNWGYWSELAVTAELALRFADALGDDPGRAKAYGYLGTARMREGDTPGALEHFGHALAIFRQAGDPVGTCRMLNNLALCHRRLGDYAASADHLREVIRVRRGLADERGEATALDNLGLVFQSMGRHTAAIRAHEQSRAIVQRLGDPSLEAFILLNLAETVRLAGRPDDAAELFREAGKLAGAAGNQAAAAESLDGLATILEGWGRAAEAEFCRRGVAAIRAALSRTDAA